MYLQESVGVKKCLPASCLVERFVLKRNNLVLVYKTNWTRTKSNAGWVKSVARVWHRMDVGSSVFTSRGLLFPTKGTLWIFVIIENKYVGQPEVCHTTLRWLWLWLIIQHRLDAIPAQLPGADWTGGRKKRVASLRNFPQIQQKVFYSAFFCLTNPNKVCALHTVIHMALVWLGKVDFSLFLPVVINYTDIVLAQSARGLLDSFGGSSKVKLWSLISALDFNIPLRGQSGALFCLCRLCSAGTHGALAEGEQPM